MLKPTTFCKVILFPELVKNKVKHDISIDRTNLNIIDSWYEEFNNSGSIGKDNISINNTPLVNNPSIIASNVAPCATDTSMIEASDNSTDTHASGDISAPTINADEDDDSLPFNDPNLIARTNTPNRIDALREERTALERQASLAAIELAEMVFD